MPKSFQERIAGALDHPIDAACAARPPSVIWATALGAGLGAGIGSVGGGSALSAGIGGGVGVLVAYLILWITVRGSGLTLGMALVLAADRLEIHRLSSFGTRPVGLIRAIRYTDIREVQATDRWLEVRLTVIAEGEPLIVHTSKRGIGAGRQFAEALQRRIAA